MAKKKTAKKTARKRAKRTTRKPAAGKVNKSAEIRAFAAANPSMGPTAIAKALREKGIAVSPSFVSAIKGKKSAKKRSRKPSSRSTAARPTAGASVTIDQLKQAKRFANAMGGIGKAKAAMDGLAQVLSD